MSKVRVKFKAFPGQVSKQFKIAMLEGDTPLFNGWSYVSRRAARQYKRDVLVRERAVFREQTKQLVQEQLA